MTLVLDREALIAAGALDWPAALADVIEVLRLMRTAEAEMVPEAVLPLGPDPRHKAYALPARVGGRFAAAGVKWTVHRPQAGGGGEAITSTTLVEDLDSNRPLGQTEAALLTRVRTAAVTAAALSALCPDLRRVAVLGAGAIAQIHLSMLQALFPDLSEIALWSRQPRKAPEPGTGMYRVSHSLPDAVAGADAVIACTSATVPFLDRHAAAPGRMICQIGFDEAANDLIDASRGAIVVDGWGAHAETSAKSLFRMYREGRIARSDISADLGDVLHGGWRPPVGRPVYFSSFGLNTLDIALAARLLRAAGAHPPQGGPT